MQSASINAFDAAKYWGPIDSINNSSYKLSSKSLGSVPIGFGGYQNPKTGNNFIISFFYCDTSTCAGATRYYPRNRLKQTLKINTAYCAKYHIVNTNNNVVAIDSYGIFFGSSIIDTIKHCTHPLTYLSPQIENQNGIVTDTASWVAITGTFTAMGNEKYMVLGNFKSNNLTNTLIINPAYLPSKGTDIYIDDVSLIELDLPAFAGNDTTCIPGTSVYIGRQRDVGIDEACMWYKLPITITPTTPAIDTAAGIWVSPTETSTYIVRQAICGNVKWDTVMVYKDGVGLNNIELTREDINIYPNPTKNKINFVYNQNLKTEFNISMCNLLGELVYNQKSFKLEEEINIDFLPAGIYYLKLENEEIEKVFKVMKN